MACREKPPAAPTPKSAAPAGPVFRLHFAGLDSLATGTNTARLNDLLNNPEAVATRKQLHDRLAQTLPDVLFGPDAARTNRSALLRPLLGELAASKFLFETHDERSSPSSSTPSDAHGGARTSGSPRIPRRLSYPQSVAKAARGARNPSRATSSRSRCSRIV